ncbi:GNAT family N-acetyltransferase [Umezawaea sp. Da 62-37]|uniref:GNAT family N-acetyltransferase n=1 Tax=Umezawaea sp. Da 62-37 TaxID=3075927 RepID=UPI0028F6D59B|nr:GNAT family N-acetyltransferase [Umezawaea sp. Da 62-37]WNV88068.1 GNAT family N-acetyltransferase [Umezawaea sp. Da 62-37]
MVRSVDDLSPGTAAVVKAAGANMNYGTEFMRAYERYPIQAVHGNYYVELLDDADEVVAFAPCFVQGDPLGALGLGPGEHALLSQVWHCSDTRLVAAEATPEIATELLDAMREVAASLGLARTGFINVADGSPSAHALESAGLKGVHLDTRYWLDLAKFGSEEGVIASIKPTNRREYQRHWRRATEAGVKITTRHPGADEQVSKLNLLLTTMDRVGSPGYYDAEKLVKFLAETPTAWIIEIALDEKPLGFAILFVDDTRLHAWALGYDRETKLAFSPYYLMWGSFMRLGYELGLPTLEAGRRNGEFKMRHGLVPQDLSAYVVDV